MLFHDYSFKNFELFILMPDDLSFILEARTKGFSPEGIFHTDKPKSVYSLISDKPDAARIPLLMMYQFIEKVCTCVRVLAAETNFFGKKFYKASDIIRNDDMLFIVALLTRTHGIMAQNTYQV